MQVKHATRFQKNVIRTSNDQIAPILSVSFTETATSSKRHNVPGRPCSLNPALWALDDRVGLGGMLHSKFERE